MATVRPTFGPTPGATGGDGCSYPREEADAVLREAMEVCGASSLIRNAVYQALEKFGGSHRG